MRRRITHDYLGFFVERLEEPVKAERGSEAISIGTNVRGNRKAIVSFNEFNYLAEH
jgi:hypothetical protein